VRRSDSDYTRIVALNAPERRPESTADEVRGYAQWKVDVLDLQSKAHATVAFQDVVAACGERCIEMVAWRDPELGRRSRETGRPLFSWVLTFRKLLLETAFVADMQSMLRTLEQAYEYPVDAEFTANFLPDGTYRINLVQCRPFQVSGGGSVIPAPAGLPDSDVLLSTKGAVVGPGRVEDVSRLIYVAPQAYNKLTQSERYAVARLIGRLTRVEPRPAGALMLAGPGRWGTSEPSLGVPVSFAEISRAHVICEVIEASGGLVPDVSLGTHFFNDLVERNVLYLALEADREGNFINSAALEQMPNSLVALLPDEAQWSHVVRVIETEGRRLRLHADAVKQTGLLYLHR
jgi:hypothetical protein